MALDLNGITQEVSEIAGVVDSAVALISSLADVIRSTPANQDALNALAASLDSKANELAAAVASVPQA